MSNSDHRSKITVEDLLRLKRAERPAAEFWTNFERELREKQLTALIEKRSWWHELPHFLARRAYVPVGAVAVLAFTLISVKYYIPDQVAQQETSRSAGLTAVIPSSITSNHSHASVPVSSVLLNRSELPALRLEDDSVGVATVAEASAPAAAELMPSLLAPATVDSPSARSIAANLASLEQSEPELVNSVLGSRLSPPARVLTAAAPVAELAAVSLNVSRRNRLFAQYTDRPLSPEPTAPALVRERLSRRLGDSEITDRLSRIGLKGDQVSLGLTLRL